MILYLMKTESFARAKDEIESFFKQDPFPSYTRDDLIEIFERFRIEWRIAAYRNYKDFASFLEENKILHKEQLTHQHTNSVKQLWNKPNVNHFQKGLTIKKEGYISYFSAMQVHQITLQIPKTIFISFDQYGSYKSGKVQLEQEAVDKAFSKPQRTSSEIYKSSKDAYRYTFLQKKTNSVDVGVTSTNQVRVTNLERTLIDIAVRPAYSGGVFEVLEAYKNALKDAKTEILDEYLDQLDYIYPYHQLVGFYLEKAGYSSDQLLPFLKKKSEINFYLTYNMSKTQLNKKWGIFYPMGF